MKSSDDRLNAMLETLKKVEENSKDVAPLQEIAIPGVNTKFDIDTNAK